MGSWLFKVSVLGEGTLFLSLGPVESHEGGAQCPLAEGLRRKDLKAKEQSKLVTMSIPEWYD